MTHDPLCPYFPGDSTERICTGCYEHDCECCQCDLIAKVRADTLDRVQETVKAVREDERQNIADSVYERMVDHPYEYPSDYAEADREWIKAGCPRDAINALKERT